MFLCTVYVFFSYVCTCYLAGKACTKMAVCMPIGTTFGGLCPTSNFAARRDSGNSSSAAPSESGRRRRPQDSWVADAEDDDDDDDDDGEQRHRHRLDRRSRRESDGQEQTLRVRVPGATVPAAGPPSQDGDTATEYTEFDSISGGGRSAQSRRLDSDDGDGDGRFSRPPGGGGGGGSQAAAEARSSASHRDRDRGPGRSFGGGGTGWEGPPPPPLSGLGGLASSRGSLGSSSLRSSGTRRRVELRTPAEEEAVRKVSLLFVVVEGINVAASYPPMEFGIGVAYRCACNGATFVFVVAAVVCVFELGSFS